MFFEKRSNSRSAQPDKVSDGAEPGGKIAGERPDIGAFAANDIDHRVIVA